MTTTDTGVELCKAGLHPMTEANRHVMPNGGLRCRTCMRDQAFRNFGNRRKPTSAGDAVEPDAPAPRDSGPAVDEDADPKEPRRVLVFAGGKDSKALQDALDECRDNADWIQSDIRQWIGPAAPVLDTYWEKRQNQVTTDWTVLCRHHPKLLSATLKASEYKAYIGLGEFAAGLAVAGAVETGFLAADGRLAAMTGVAEAWAKVMAEREELAGEIGREFEERLAQAESARWVGPLSDIG